MAEKYIIVDIMPDGTVKTDMEGFTDKSCQKVADKLQDLLEAQRVQAEPRPEYFHEVQLSAFQKIKQKLGG